MTKKTSNRFSPEVRHRAVRMGASNARGSLQHWGSIQPALTAFGVVAHHHVPQRLPLPPDHTGPHQSGSILPKRWRSPKPATPRIGPQPERQSAAAPKDSDRPLSPNRASRGALRIERESDGITRGIPENPRLITKSGNRITDIVPVRAGAKVALLEPPSSYRTITATERAGLDARPGSP